MRHDFKKFVTKHKGEKLSKGFRCWEQFTAMLFGQLSSQKGLRSIESGLLMNEKSLYHLGVSQVKQSNNKRSHEIYRNLFFTLLYRFQTQKEKHKFRFKNPLFSIDASTIDLCLSLFPWADFRKSKAGIKLHMKLDHSGYIPDFASITKAKYHERKGIQIIPVKKRDVLVFDRRYNDFGLFSNYYKEWISFVTRLNSNAAYKLLSINDTDSYENITFDKIIKMTGCYTTPKCKEKLRLIKSYDPDTGKAILLLPKNITWAPNIIAMIYKDRWQIEIFFKTIMQNQKIKSFFGYKSEYCYYSDLDSIDRLSTFEISGNYFFGRLACGYANGTFSVMLFQKVDIWSWLNKLKPDPGSNQIDCGQMEFSL